METAARSSNKNDREFWLKMANRWEGLLASPTAPRCKQSNWNHARLGGGAADCGEYREVVGAIAQAVKREAERRIGATSEARR
jgi:hypothetical protein